MDYIKHVDNGESRIAGICEALKKSDLDDHAEAVTNGLVSEKEICDEKEITRHAFTDPLTIKVYERVSESLGRGQDFVRAAAAGMSDRWSETCEQIPDILKRLALLVPPSELIQAGKRNSNAASLSAIILACWIERLVKEQNDTLDLSEYRRLCRLMLKAIEDAELKREFADWRPK